MNALDAYKKSKETKIRHKKEFRNGLISKINEEIQYATEQGRYTIMTINMPHAKDHFKSLGYTINEISKGLMIINWKLSDFDVLDFQI